MYGECHVVFLDLLGVGVGVDVEDVVVVVVIIPHVGPLLGRQEFVGSAVVSVTFDLDPVAEDHRSNGVRQGSYKSGFRNEWKSIRYTGAVAFTGFRRIESGFWIDLQVN